MDEIKDIKDIITIGRSLCIGLHYHAVFGSDSIKRLLEGVMVMLSDCTIYCR